jgi:hypothetical protein
MSKQKNFIFKIQEHTTYWQEGTVSVVAKDIKLARKKVLDGKYDHHGDNTILLDTEGKCLKREIIEEVGDDDL